MAEELRCLRVVAYARKAVVVCIRRHANCFFALGLLLCSAPYTMIWPALLCPLPCSALWSALLCLCSVSVSALLSLTLLCSALLCSALSALLLLCLLSSALLGFDPLALVNRSPRSSVCRNRLERGALGEGRRGGSLGERPNKVRR